MKTTEHIAGNLEEIASSLDSVASRLKQNPVALYTVDTEYLRYLSDALLKTVQAIEYLRNGEEEWAKEVLEKIEF